MRTGRRRPHRPRAAARASASTAGAIPGLPGRHAGLGAARQRRASRRPLVQISPAARHPVRRRRGAERAGRRSIAATARVDAQPARHAGRALRRAARRAARTAGRRSRFDLGAVNDAARAAASRRASTTRPSCGRAASWQHALRAARSAPPPGLGRAPDAARSRPLRAPLRALRRAGGRRRPGRARRGARRRAEAGARVILCDEQAELGGSLLAETRRARIDGKPAPDWLARPRRDARAPRRTSRCCRAPPRSAISRTISSASPSASPTISPIPTADLPRERLWQVRAKRGRARHRRHRAPAGVSRQRPARHHAGRRRADLSSTATACRPARAPSSSPRTTAPIARRSTCRRAGCRHRRDRRSARSADGALADAARAAGHAGPDGHDGARHQRAAARAAVQLAQLTHGGSAARAVASVRPAC